MISVNGINKRFVQRSGEPLDVLKDVTLTVDDHEFLSIIGPSGCGKTTLLKIVDGLVSADSGEVIIKGKTITGPGPDRAVVFQNFLLLPWADVLSNIAFGLEMRGVSKRDSREVARSQLERVSLLGFEHHYPHELSGGMQQRVGLARALAVDPEILLMDEPFGALDAQTRTLMQGDLLRIWQGERKTVMFITHSMEEAVFLSDRVIIMDTHPGRVHGIVEIPFSRPRDESVRGSATFAELTSHMWQELKTIIQKDPQQFAG